MKTLILEFKDFTKVKEIVENDGVVAFPTETVYGLGVRYDSFLAYNKIFEAKQRPENKTLTLMLHDKNDIDKYVIVTPKVRKLIDCFMPGEVTIVLPKRNDVEVYGSEETIGLRIPDSEETLRFLKNISIPMFVTSANLSGLPAATTFPEVVAQLDNRIEVIVKGEANNKVASTVFSVLDDKITILREGPVSLTELERVYNS